MIKVYVSYIFITVASITMSWSATAQGIKILDQRPYESYYKIHETTINHPLEKVWPHVLNIGGWMINHEMETISGEPGQEGHLVKVMPHGIGDEVPLPHYHLYGITKIIPYKYIALEIFNEEGGSYGVNKKGMSFDSILLNEVNGKTKITFLITGMSFEKTADQKKSQTPEEIKKAAEQFDKRFKGFWKNLSGLVEGNG